MENIREQNNGASDQMMRKLNVIEFWFYEWLIMEKGITMEAFGLMKNQTYRQYEKEFIAYYNSIK